MAWTDILNTLMKLGGKGMVGTPQIGVPGVSQDGAGSGMAGTLTAGDGSIWSGRELPRAPSNPGLYDLLQDYLGGMQNSYNLGVPPPQAPTAEDMMRWRAQTSPWAEEQILNKTNPQQFFKKRKETVEI
jgi:hypothetical protein